LNNLNPNILVIRQLALGDVLLCTPIIKQLYRDHNGQCNIDVLTMKPDIFLNNPYVRKILTPQTYPENNEFYTKTINLDLAYEKQPHIHIIDAYATFSHGYPSAIKDKRIELFSTNEDRLKAKAIQNELIKGDYIVIHMRKDKWPSRNLAESTWKSIVDLILEQTSYKVVQVGSLNEIAFNHDPRLLNFLGALSIHELKEIISDAKYYYGIDSGTLHIAASTNTPIISMFTSAHHRLREPLDRPQSAHFIPIQPDIDCYGCQENYTPPITGVVCHRGDPYSPPCKDSFRLGIIQDSLKKIAFLE